MTGSYQISYTPEAYRDLEAIYSYIAFTLQKNALLPIKSNVFGQRFPPYAHFQSAMLPSIGSHGPLWECQDICESLYRLLSGWDR